MKMLFYGAGIAFFGCLNIFGHHRIVQKNNDSNNIHDLPLPSNMTQLTENNNEQNHLDKVSSIDEGIFHQELRVKTNSNNNMFQENPQQNNVTKEQPPSKKGVEKISTYRNETKEAVVVVVQQQGREDDGKEEEIIRQQLLSDCCTFPTTLYDDENQKTEQTVSASTIKTIEIVVAYCKSDLSWMYDTVLDQIEKFSNKLEIKITILSKCGNEDKLEKANLIADPRVGNYTVKQISNVGGCDYAYALFLDEYMNKYSFSTDKEAAIATAQSTLFLFTKDTPRTKKNLHVTRDNDSYRDIYEMMQLGISSNNLVCGVKPVCQANYSHTHYHDTRILGNFYMPNYVRVSSKNKYLARKKNRAEFNTMNYVNYADFLHRGLNYSFPNDKVVKVCYGGTFAVPAERVLNLSKDVETRNALKLLRNALSRNTTTGVTLEEHFAERTWAGMLALPASEVETKLVKQIWPRILMRKGVMPGIFFNKIGKNIC